MTERVAYRRPDGWVEELEPEEGIPWGGVALLVGAILYLAAFWGGVILLVMRLVG